MENRIVVIGSTNIDMVMNLKSLPKPGETIGEGNFQIFNGGKGANQAVAAARAGGHVHFISCVGNDRFTTSLMNGFKKDGISTDHVSILDRFSTGTAVIMVDEKAENCIGVAPAANGQLSPTHIRQAKSILQAADYILIQFEIPIKTVEYVIELAARMGKKVLVNPAPAVHLSNDLLKKIEILVLNESEAATLSRQHFEAGNESKVAQYFLNKGVRHVILTLGARGAYIANTQEQQFVEAFKVKAVDTTAAGDIFCGALAAALSNETTLSEAARYASAASAIAVTRAGAQPSAPTRKEIEQFLSRRNS